jgi:hypothetical protein
MDHYDLLLRQDWTAESILIVSPYVEVRFFKKIIDDLTPATLIVVVDDGCRSDDIVMIKNLAQKGTEVSIVLGSAPGLVHAKIFHIEWATSGGNRAHSLVYGSGNATHQAFAGCINEELMCSVRLTVANHKPILDWMQEVRSAALTINVEENQIGPVKDAWLANGMYIRLPSLRIRPADSKVSNFDLWLQRGSLLSKFQPDTSFLRVNVSLLEALPAGDLVQSIQNIGFETPMLERLRIPYISGLAGDDNGDAIGGNWLSQYFIWTQLGYWCSSACFKKNKSRFKRRGHEQRLENLRLLKELKKDGPREDALSLFLRRISDLWTVLGDRAATYLECLDGDVDLPVYQVLFDERLNRDLELAGDREFCDRYINGCEVIDVPRFRTDATGWRSFTDSFMRQLHVEWLKARSQSRIYNYIYGALEDEYDDDIFDHPGKLASILRECWNEEQKGEKTTVGQYIDRYHDE